MASAVKSPSSTPHLSFSRAASCCLMLCRARLKTVQGVPKCTYLIRPPRIQDMMVNCVDRRLQSNWLPPEMSTGEKTAIPKSARAPVSLAVPAKTSRNAPECGDLGFTLRTWDDSLWCVPNNEQALSLVPVLPFPLFKDPLLCLTSCCNWIPALPAERNSLWVLWRLFFPFWSWWKRESLSAGLRSVSMWRSLHLKSPANCNALAWRQTLFNANEVDRPLSKLHKAAMLSVKVTLIFPWRCATRTVRLKMMKEQP